MFRVNGRLLPALIDQAKLTVLLAQQCFEADTISLSFRTDSLDEYTSVIHLTGASSANQRPGASGNNSSPTGNSSRRSPDRSAQYPTTSPSKHISFSGTPNQSMSLERERPAFLPIGLSASDPRWVQLSIPQNKENETTPPKNSLPEFLNEMRLELGRVRALAQQKVDAAEKQRSASPSEIFYKLTAYLRVRHVLRFEVQCTT